MAVTGAHSHAEVLAPKRRLRCLNHCPWCGDHCCVMWVLLLQCELCSCRSQTRMLRDVMNSEPSPCCGLCCSTQVHEAQRILDLQGVWGWISFAWGSVSMGHSLGPVYLNMIIVLWVSMTNLGIKKGSASGGFFWLLLLYERVKEAPIHF